MKAAPNKPAEAGCRTSSGCRTSTSGSSSGGGNLVVLTGGNVGSGDTAACSSFSDLQAGDWSTSNWVGDGGGVSLGNLTSGQWAVSSVDSGQVGNSGETSDNGRLLTLALLLSTGNSDGGGLWRSSLSLTNSGDHSNWSQSEGGGEWAVGSVHGGLIGDSGDTSDNGLNTSAQFLSTSFGESDSTRSSLGNDGSTWDLRGRRARNGGRRWNGAGSTGRRRAARTNVHSGGQVVNTLISLGTLWVKSKSEGSSVRTWLSSGTGEDVGVVLLCGIIRSVNIKINVSISGLVVDWNALSVSVSTTQGWVESTEALTERQNVQRRELKSSRDGHDVFSPTIVLNSPDGWSKRSGWSWSRR
ncbi:hypothetical protein OGATHE_002626 [Ogataea polymorpha]|uniref:Uncharacterized protein n=1 Tax=Ogataea polymorpha TaxID=460523 RepID=A0A9P8T8R3_9ASCO|nr:hypothetical protein OGATHE_002626 [Ogataea polymorpha]